MLSWPPTVRIFLVADATDMRKGFDSLAHLVESSLALDPLSGHLFVFRSRRGDRIKILYWDKDGYALWYKRLEKGSFRFPAAAAADGDQGRGDQGGGSDDDPRRDRSRQRPAATTLFPRNCQKIRDEGPFRSQSRRYNPGMCESAAPLPNDLDLCHEIIRQQADHHRGGPAADRAAGAPGRAAAPSPVRSPAGERRSRPAPPVHRRRARRRRRG